MPTDGFEVAGVPTEAFPCSADEASSPQIGNCSHEARLRVKAAPHPGPLSCHRKASRVSLATGTVEHPFHSDDGSAGRFPGSLLCRMPHLFEHSTPTCAHARMHASSLVSSESDGAPSCRLTEGWGGSSVPSQANNNKPGAGFRAAFSLKWETGTRVTNRSGFIFRARPMEK